MDRDERRELNSIAKEFERAQNRGETQQDLETKIKQSIVERNITCSKGSAEWDDHTDWIVGLINRLDAKYPNNNYSDKYLDHPNRVASSVKQKELQEEVKKTEKLNKELAKEVKKTTTKKIKAQKDKQEVVKKAIQEQKVEQKKVETKSSSKSNPITPRGTKKVDVSNIKNKQKITKSPEIDFKKELSLAKEFVKFLKVKYSSIKDVSSKYKSHENYKQGMVPVEISIDDLRSLMGMT